MKTLKVAVVGCGNIGKRHIAILNENPKTALVAICDSNETVLKEQSVLFDNVPYFTHYQSLLNQVEADVIAICTPMVCIAR